MNRIHRDLVEWGQLSKWQRDLLEKEARDEAELVAADKHKVKP